jgi:hypothetical protein
MLKRTSSSSTAIGFNPKVNNLSNLVLRARHPLLLISDSNVRVPQDYLKDLVAHRVQAGGGLVWSLFRGIQGRGLGGMLGLLFDCYQQSISVPIFLLTDHSLVDVNDPSYGWFLRNRWHEVSYYAVAPGIAPAGGGACVDAVTCLRVTYHPSDGKQRGIIVIGGTKIGAQARPPLVASDLFEDANADGASPFTLRSPALLTGRTFNDHIAVLDANP